ncbi:sulfurtransferase TusA family protein [Dactylosporangium sp. NPDC000555]|uniref:sulfurtransferase TusA family protein n=1 Tax=Dactylosporangium sp. NPDC000555 TaxID=3154260 RepID=UPI00331D89D8
MTAQSPEIRVFDGGDQLCVTLLLDLRRFITGLPAATMVHVIATDPAAPLDLPAWCHLTGHHYLGPVPAQRFTYALRLAAATQPTAAANPWHPAQRT